jgi:predicted permease
MEAATGPDDWTLLPVATLAPGATREDVRRELQLLGGRLKQIDSANYRGSRTGGLYAMRSMVDRGRDKGPITMMVLLTVGGAVCVLLVACTNVASVMLARAARRRGEMAIRASVGASRWQMIRQQIIESLMLAITAGTIGTLLSLWGIRLVLAMLPAEVATNFLPGWTSFGLDANVLAFAALASLLTVLVFGLWPAREATRFDLTRALKGADPSIAGEDPTRRIHLPVVLELTFSLPLFVGAVLMLRSFSEVANADRGYAMDNRYRVRVFSTRQDSGYADYTRLMRELHERLSSSRTVGEVALELNYIRLPADTSYSDHVVVASTGRTLYWRELGGISSSVPNAISDNFFGVMGMRIINGRRFNESDGPLGRLVAIVSKRFATEAWGSGDPIGQELVVTKRGLKAVVVGVASDRSGQRNEMGGVAPAREVYFSYRQAETRGGGTLVVHSTLPIPTLSAALNQSLRDLGRERQLSIDSFETELGRLQLMPRMFSSVLGTFATAGLILAIMGIYGVVAFSVEQRTREIGVRIALGATSVDVIRHVMRGGLRLVGIAIVLGLAASAMVGRVLTAFVTGSTAAHLVTAVFVAIGFGAIAAAACWFPARRAAALDPLRALRAE